MASTDEIVKKGMIYSRKVKEMYAECQQAIVNCHSSPNDKRNVHLYKIYDLSKSLYDIVREKELWKEYIISKNSMDKMLEKFPEEDIDDALLFDMTYNLSKDITLFYSCADHFTWKLMDYFKNNGYLNKYSITAKDVEMIKEFLMHIKATYTSMQKLERRIEEYALHIRETDKIIAACIKSLLNQYIQ